MAINVKELNKSIELLLNQITAFKQQIQSMNECEENQINLKNKKQLKGNNKEINITNEKKLQEKETEFDQINELYLRNKVITENETKINDLINPSSQKWHF